MNKMKKTKTNVGANDHGCPIHKIKMNVGADESRRPLKTNHAITLIALILTIIVLLILAVVAIRAVQGDGIISHAKKAKSEYEKGQAEEQKKLSEYELLLAQEAGTAWKQEGTKVTKGATTLEVGAVVGTDVKINGKLPTLENDNTWAVLGAENGKLLLTTTKNLYKGTTVQMATFNGNDDIYKEITIETVEGGAATKTIVIDEDKINQILKTFITDTCGINITDTVADNIRSINVDDINRVTTYNPENIGLAHNGGPYGKNNSNEYGNIVRYKASEPIVARNGATGTTNTICKLPKATANSEFTVKSNYYYYYPETLTDSSGTKPTDKWYNLLFANTSSGDTYYWLASPYVIASPSYANWGLRFVYNGHWTFGTLWYSDDGARTPSNGVRPVVSLASDVQIQ